MVEAGFMHQRGNLWLSAVHNQNHKSVMTGQLHAVFIGNW
jgi:hypothetical protein